MNDSATSCESFLGRYRGYLQFVADMHLDRRLQAKIGPSDIVQETMVQAFRGWHDLRGTSEGERLAWLKQILVRKLLHAVRDFQRAKRDVRREQPFLILADQSSSQLAAVCDADQTSPSQLVMQAEEMLAVADALQQLPEGQRAALVAYYWRGDTLAQVGDELGKSKAAVAGLIYRGVKRLREQLSKSGSSVGL